MITHGSKSGMLNSNLNLIFVADGDKYLESNEGDVKVIIGEKMFSNIIRELSYKTLESDGMVLYGDGFLEGF